MHTLDMVEDFANKHIESIIEMKDVTPHCIKMLGELVDIVKDISEYRKNDSTTYAMDNYSPEKTVEYTRRYSDSTPHENVSYNRRPMMYGDAHQMIQKMEEMRDVAQTEQEKQIIQDCIDKLKNN